MKQCTKCGQDYSDETNFCRFCGSRTISVQRQTMFQSVSDQSQAMPPPASENNQRQTMPPPTFAKNRKKPKWPWIAAGALVLLAIGIILFIRNPEKPLLPAGKQSTGGSVEGSLAIVSLVFDPSYPADKLRNPAGEWLEQRDVALGQECIIVFNQPVLKSEENKQHIAITQWDGTAVPTELQIQGETVVVKPVREYLPGQAYRFQIDAQLQSSKGSLLEEPVSFGFITSVQEKTTPILTQTLQPSKNKQQITAESGFKLVIPGDFLTQAETVTVNEISGSYVLTDPLGADPIACYEVKIGSIKSFSKPVYLEVPFRPEQISSTLPAEHALKACYWDETLYRWVDAELLVDKENNRVIIPTLHLTKWSIYATKADGHIYNDYFSLYYSSEEMKQIEEKSYTGFKASEYIDGVFDAFNEARGKYEKEGFRHLEKIQAIHEVHVQEYHQAIPVPYFNIYLTGDVLQSNASRNKYTGKITIPVDQYTGVNYFQIAHELFHNFQNRYYYAIGMSELGVPLTTAPSNQLLSRQWWLEGSADYAAGRVAYPDGDKPHPEMGGIINAKHLEKPLTHSPTALAFWAPEDRHSYNNAWFFEFLVQQKKVSFKDMFEAVASYYNPSLYSNLSSYLKEKKLDINQVYSDYALWWFSHPGSPLTDGARQKGMENTLMLEYPAEAEHTFIFPQWHTDNQHTTKALKVFSGEKDVEKRYLILWPVYEMSDPDILRTFVLPLDKKNAVTPQDITQKNQYLVQSIGQEDALYVLAVNNMGFIWTPKIRIGEVDLIYEYIPLEGGHSFKAEAAHIPDFLREGLKVIWEVDGKDAFVDDKPEVMQDGEEIKVKSEYQLKEIEEHRIRIKVLDANNQIIAEKNIKEENITLKVEPPQIKDGKAGEEITFEMEAASLPKQIQQVLFVWDMKDGQLESTGSALADAESGKAAVTVSYSFAPGPDNEEEHLYQAEVIVKDPATGEELVKVRVPVQIVRPQVVIQAPRSVTYELRGGASEAEHTFEAYAKNASKQAYIFGWDFGDGSPVQETSGMESSVTHVYRKAGKYYPKVSLYSPGGEMISTDSVYVALEAEGGPTPEPETQKADPWRKYDEGFAPLDYSKLYFYHEGRTVTYYNKQTDEKEGMYIYFADDACTRPETIEYYLPEEEYIRMDYTTFDVYGRTYFHENGKIKYMERYDYSGSDVIWYSKGFNDQGRMTSEVNYKNEDYHGRSYVEDWEAADDFHWRLDSKTYYVEEEFYQDGQKHGTCRYSFYNIPWEDPIRWETVAGYSNGVQHGETLSYDEKGNLTWYSRYDNGKVIESKKMGD